MPACRGRGQPCGRAQVDERNNPHGLEHGWRWLASLLNTLPPDRPSAKALYSFLRMAGYGLHNRWVGGGVLTGGGGKGGSVGA